MCEDFPRSYSIIGVRSFSHHSFFCSLAILQQLQHLLFCGNYVSMLPGETLLSNLTPSRDEVKVNVADESVAMSRRLPLRHRRFLIMRSFRFLSCHREGFPCPLLIVFIQTISAVTFQVRYSLRKIVWGYYIKVMLGVARR